MSETPPPATEVPDDVEGTDKNLQDEGLLDDAIKGEQDYLDEQRIEESEVAEMDPADAGDPLQPVDEDTSSHVIEADESQVDLPDPQPEPGDAE
jgi:hypothetical protein